MHSTISGCLAYLIEEDILSVGALSGKLLHNPFWTDTMFGTKLLPELETNYIMQKRILLYHNISTSHSANPNYVSLTLTTKKKSNMKKAI